MALRIKNIIRGMSLRQWVFSLTALCSLIIYVVLTVWISHQLEGLIDQQAAARWDAEGGSAQVSCFFAEGVEIDDFRIKNFEKQLEQSIQEVLTEPDQGGGSEKRLFIDATSSVGKITLTSEKAKLEADAVGVGGDFFLFHPLQLLYGRYFSESDLMTDWIILDEDAAWQLFGSNDIAGQSVMIGGIPHYVAGVIRRQEGRFAANAGLDKTVVYVSNESLSAYGSTDGISVYEVTAPNPVKGFVSNCVKEKLGVDESDMIVVENSSRYSLESMIPVILDFGTRSMQDFAVRFPYWENIGRGWEDVRALVLVFQIFFLMIFVVICAGFLIIKWRNRGFTWKDVGAFLIAAKDRAVERSRREKDRWEHF